jgi:hypothetical protein
LDSRIKEDNRIELLGTVLEWIGFTSEGTEVRLD